MFWKEMGHFIAQKENIGKTFPKSDWSKMNKHFCSNSVSITITNTDQKATWERKGLFDFNFRSHSIIEGRKQLPWKRDALKFLRKCPCWLSQRLSDGGIFLNWCSPFPDDPAHFMLTKNKNYQKQNIPPTLTSIIFFKLRNENKKLIITILVQHCTWNSIQCNKII